MSRCNGVSHRDKRGIGNRKGAVRIGWKAPIKNGTEKTKATGEGGFVVITFVLRR